MPTGGPPGDSILQQRDLSDLICSNSAPAPVLQKGMPGSASKQKKVIDPAEEKEEPEARDRDSNWKNAMLMLLPKSILPARSCCGCGALCWTFGDSQIWRGVWQIPCIRKHLQTAYERCRKPKEATRNYLRLQTSGSRQLAVAPSTGFLKVGNCPRTGWDPSAHCTWASKRVSCRTSFPGPGWMGRGRSDSSQLPQHLLHLGISNFGSSTSSTVSLSGPNKH